MSESEKCAKCPLHCEVNQKAIEEKNKEIERLGDQLANSQVNHQLDNAMNSLNLKDAAISGLAHSTAQFAKTSFELESRNKAMQVVCVNLQKQCNCLSDKLAKVETKIKEQETTIWNLHTREGARRLCEFLEIIVQDEEALKDFIEENKNNVPPLTLTKADIRAMILYRPVLSNYLSCTAHEKFKIEIIKQLPDHLKEVGNDDIVEFKYAGSRKLKTIRFDRKLVNAMIYLLDQGYGDYIEAEEETK